MGTVKCHTEPVLPSALFIIPRNFIAHSALLNIIWQTKDPERSRCFSDKLYETSPYAADAVGAHPRRRQRRSSRAVLLCWNSSERAKPSRGCPDNSSGTSHSDSHSDFFFFFLNLVSQKGLKESQIRGTIRDPPPTHTNYHYSYLKGTSALSEPSECSAHSSRLPSKGIDLGDASLSMEREGICALQ